MIIKHIHDEKALAIAVGHPSVKLYSATFNTLFDSYTNSTYCYVSYNYPSWVILWYYYVAIIQQ